MGQYYPATTNDCPSSSADGLADGLLPLIEASIRRRRRRVRRAVIELLVSESTEQRSTSCATTTACRRRRSRRLFRGPVAFHQSQLTDDNRPSKDSISADSRCSLRNQLGLRALLMISSCADVNTNKSD